MLRASSRRKDKRGFGVGIKKFSFTYDGSNFSPPKRASKQHYKFLPIILENYLQIEGVIDIRI